MKKIVILLMLTLLTACSTKQYVTQKCPYIEPMSLNLQTDNRGQLDRNSSYMAVQALKYYGTEARRLKKFVLKGNK